MTPIPFVLLGVVLALLIIEIVLVRRIVRHIPIRVHINGSRGKSSVTRYIVAGLRSGGKRTMGKITGVHPTMMLPDQQREIIRRWGPANIREQFKMVRLAKKLSCDALVLECMSIAPSLQQIETTILQPHVTVLTNILEDHLEELGHTDAERTEAYCSSLPANSIVVTHDYDHIREIEKAASLRNTRVILPTENEIIMGDTTLNVIQREHVNLALMVCKCLGVDEQRALSGILDEIQNDEVLYYTFPVGGYTVRFVNGFAVNDVASANKFLETWKEHLGNWENLAFVLNTRSDRPRRSMEFARWCSEVQKKNTIILTGTHIPFTRRILKHYGIPDEYVYTWSSKQVQEPYKALEMIIRKETTIFGFGNIAGDGFALLDALQPFKSRKGTSHDY